MTNIESTSAKTPFAEAFGELPRAVEPAWLSKRRREAFASFDAQGIPTRHHEDWRYLDLSAIQQIPFRHSPRGGSARIDASALEAALRSAAGGVANSVLDRLAGFRLVFVDGRYAPEFSKIPALPSGMVVTNLEKAWSDRPDEIARHLTQHASFRDYPFVALNTAFMQDGAYVSIGRGQGLSDPLHLVHVQTSGGSSAAHPRHLIVLEEGASANILEDYVSVGEEAALDNPVMEIVLGPAARLGLHKLARESGRTYHLAGIFARLERDSDLASFSVVRGGKLVRNDMRVEQTGTGASCVLNGLNVICGAQVADDHTTVIHGVPHGTSRQYYKSILDERAEGVFNGKVFVMEGAQKTSAQQSNHNLLLSDQALMNTKPQLEIFTDDVKCSHGATIGQLDPEAIYYLRSRGLDQESARTLLTEAFAGDVLSEIKSEPIHDLVSSTLTFPLCRRAGHPIRH